MLWCKKTNKKKLALKNIVEKAFVRRLVGSTLNYGKPGEQASKIGRDKDKKRNADGQHRKNLRCSLEMLPLTHYADVLHSLSATTT